MKIENPKIYIPYIIGSILVLVGATLHIFDFSIGFWLFSVGAIAVVIVRLLTLKKTEDKRVRRLQMQLLLGAGCMLGTIYLMYVGNTAWAIPLLISAFIEFWVSFRMK